MTGIEIRVTSRQQQQRRLNMRLFGSTPVLAAYALLSILALNSAHAQTQINGAGSSFAAPIYGKWGEAAAATINIPASARHLQAHR